LAEAVPEVGLSDEQYRSIQNGHNGVDDFINRRADKEAKRNKEHDLWVESVKRYHEKHHESNRVAWKEYYLNLADSIETAASALAEKNRQRAKEL
jgi:hypothetical protein